MRRNRPRLTQDTIRQLIFNRPVVRQQAMELLEVMGALSIDQCLDLAQLRYERLGWWDAPYDLAVLLRLKPDAPEGQEVMW